MTLAELRRRYADRDSDSPEPEPLLDPGAAGVRWMLDRLEEAERIIAECGAPHLSCSDHERWIEEKYQWLRKIKGEIGQ